MARLKGHLLLKQSQAIILATSSLVPVALILAVVRGGGISLVAGSTSTIPCVYLVSKIQLRTFFIPHLCLPQNFATTSGVRNQNDKAGATRTRRLKKSDQTFSRFVTEQSRVRQTDRHDGHLTTWTTRTYTALTCHQSRCNKSSAYCYPHRI